MNAAADDEVNIYLSLRSELDDHPAIGLRALVHCTGTPGVDSAMLTQHGQCTAASASALMQLLLYTQTSKELAKQTRDYVFRFTSCRPWRAHCVDVMGTAR